MIRVIAIGVLILLGANSHAADVPYKKFIAANSANMSKLTVGMTKAQVIGVMGDNSSKVPDGVLTNPYKVEALQNGADTYEVLYFLTRVHPPFTPILDNQATPVVLKDGVVVGWGRAALQLTKAD